MSDRRILFLLYNYPPEFGTASKRNLSISSYLKTFFNQHFILTQTKSSVLHDDRVITYSSPDYRNLLRKRTKSGLVNEKYKQNAFSRFLIKLLNSYPINLVLGEGGGIYLIRILSKAKKLIRTQNITHIYSSYRPISDHFVSSLLKRKFPNLVWIADFRDLVIEPIYKIQFFPNWHEKIYKRMLNEADVLTSISPQYCQKLHDYNKQVIPLINGIPEDWQVNDSVVCPHFSMVYTGSMFRSERNAEPLFIALSDLISSDQIVESHLKIKYAGKDGLIWSELARSYGLSKNFEDLGLISGSEAEELQSTSNINVMLTISSDDIQGVLTGKMIEYLKACRPILCIVKNQNDPAIEEILMDTKAGISVSDKPEDLETIKSFILSFYKKWLTTGRNECVTDYEKLMARFSMDAVFKALINKLDLQKV